MKSSSNLKYLTRLYYYGKVLNWEYVSEAMVLKIRTYTATEYFGKSEVIRIYVPTELETDILRELIVGENYFVVAAPYKLNFKSTYRHRVDLLLHIFKEIV